jgi:hypothetical protein
MSKQTFVMTPKNYPRPLGVFGEHAATRASGEAAIGSELFLKEGSRGRTLPRDRRPSELAATKTFRRTIHRLKEDVRSWYELHRRNGATTVGVWAIYLEIAGWLIDRLKGLPRRAKPTAIVAVSAAYVLLTGFVFRQAMNGVPLVRM